VGLLRFATAFLAATLFRIRLGHKQSLQVVDVSLGIDPPPVQVPPSFRQLALFLSLAKEAFRTAQFSGYFRDSKYSSHSHPQLKYPHLEGNIDILRLVQEKLGKN
jgi:hypothetical protein